MKIWRRRHRELWRVDFYDISGIKKRPDLSQQIRAFFEHFNLIQDSTFNINRQLKNMDFAQIQGEREAEADNHKDVVVRAKHDARAECTLVHEHRKSQHNKESE